MSTVLYLQRKKKQKLGAKNHSNAEDFHEDDIDHIHKKAAKKLRTKLNVGMLSIVLIYVTNTYIVYIRKVTF